MTKSIINVTHFNPNSVFESLRTYDRRIFKLNEHLARLKESAKMFGMELSGEEILNFKKIIQDGYEKSGIKNAYIRIALSVPAGKIHLIIREIKVYPETIYKKGVSIATAVSKKSSFGSIGPNIKASNFLSGICAKMDVSEKFEALMLGPQAEASEGSVSNIFIVKKKNIFTPPLSSGLLAGITRQAVFDLAGPLGIAIDERVLTRHDMYNSDECFLTNTTAGIVPVVSIDSRKIGSGRPGGITKRLAKAFRMLTGEED
jgi:branched-chain amino acid aminotransferase